MTKKNLLFVVIYNWTLIVRLSCMQNFDTLFDNYIKLSVSELFSRQVLDLDLTTGQVKISEMITAKNHQTSQKIRNIHRAGQK